MLQNLDVMANYYAVSSYLNVDAWIRLDDLTHIIPIEILNAESFLKKNKFVALDDADYSYMVRFVDYLLEETVAPLELNGCSSVLTAGRQHCNASTMKVFRNGARTAYILAIMNSVRILKALPWLRRPTAAW